MALFTWILEWCFVQLSCTCGVVGWLWEPARRWLSDEQGHGIGAGCTAPGEGEASEWQRVVRGWLLAHLGEDGYEEGLSGTAPTQLTDARWQLCEELPECGRAAHGHGALCHGLHQRLGFMAGECGSVGRDRWCLLHFHIVHHIRWNPFSCGASGDCCPLLMLPSTVWAAGSGKISQAGILVFFNGQLRKKTFSWEKS